MRLTIRHETIFLYDPPAKAIVQTLRMTPRSHDGQHIFNWRVDIDSDCRLDAGEDAFRNIVHTFSVGPVERLSVLVEGEVEAFDTAGVLRGTLERFPAELFLRDTDLTIADEAIREFARKTIVGSKTDLDRLHQLMDAVHDGVKLSSEPRRADASAADAFALGSGHAQDMAHIFIASARHLNIPARFTTGYLHLPAADAVQSSHSWAEAYVQDLGWVAFDPSLGQCPHDGHVRVAVGLDELGAMPLRTASRSGASQSTSVNVNIRQSQAQWQS